MIMMIIMILIYEHFYFMIVIISNSYNDNDWDDDVHGNKSADFRPHSNNDILYSVLFYQHSPEDRDPVPLSILHMPVCITFGFFNEG